MLALDKPRGPFAGLALWEDHAEKGAFWYMPVSPRIGRNADGPEISLLKYRDDAGNGGGFLSFSTELAVTPEQLDEARRELLREGAGDAVETVVLRAVQFQDG